MRKLFKAIFVDVGGVLVRPSVGHEDLWDLWHTKIDEVEERKIVWWEVMKGKVTVSDFNQQLLAEGVFDEEFFIRINERDKTEAINWELVEIIKKLKKKFKVGLLTNNIAPNIDFYRTKLDNYSMFDVVISSHEVGMVKPDPEIFIEAAKRVGYKLSECVFIDDWGKNVKAAEKLGMKAILYKDNKGLVKELKKLKLL